MSNNKLKEIKPKEATGGGLSDKQRRFCEEYVIDWNATRAAKDAGYSEKTAYSIGQENLKKPEIANHIETLRQKTAELAGVSALRNAMELAKIAYSSAAALRVDWEDVKDWDELTDDEKAIISEVTFTKESFGENGEIIKQRLSYKTYDKQKAIETLNKMFGWNAPEKVEGKHTINASVSGAIAELTEDQLEAQLKNLEQGE